MDESKKTVCITGGHLTPALSVVDEIVDKKLPWNIVFIGRKFAKEGDSTVSEEYTSITRLSVTFLPLIAGRIPRFISGSTIRSIAKIPIGFIQAFVYLIRYRPDIIVSFGGYIALPVVSAGWILRIPSVTHEQTQSIGLANRTISYLVKKIYVSHKHMLLKISSNKGVYVGLPLRKKLFEKHPKPKYIPRINRPILYCTGGVTGARSINTLLFPIIKNLSTKYMIVHQTGAESFADATNIRNDLDRNQQQYYYPKIYYTVEEVGWILTHAMLVVGRSGANTTAEIEALGAIALFIPLPWSAGNEQLKNAQYLCSKGSATVLEQASLDSKALEEHIHEMILHRAKYKFAAKKLTYTYPRSGTAALVSEISMFLG